MSDLPRNARRSSHIRVALRFCLLAFAILALFGPRLPAQALSPGGPVDFGSQPANSGAHSVTLVFTASVTTQISTASATTEGKTGSDFTVSSENCIGTLYPPASCEITLTFAPTQIGLRRGALAVTDASGAIVNLVFLHGIGLGPQVVLTPGVVSTYALDVTPLSPTAATIDGSGNLFYTDIASGSVFERPAGGVSTAVASVPVVANSSLAVSGFGRIYVSSPNQGDVLVITPGGATPPAILSTGSVTLVRPAGLAIDGSGFLYVADAGANSIVRVALDGSGSATLTLTGLAGALSNPTGLAIDAANNLYIADTGNNRIVQASLSTGKASVVSLGSLTLSSPNAVAVDPAGSLTISDSGNDRLVVVPASGTPFVLATTGTALSTPAGLYLLDDGDLLVADTTVGMLQVTRSTGSVAFPTKTKVGTLDAIDGALSATFQNSGNQPLQLTIGSGSNPEITSGAFAASSASTCPVVTGSSTPGAGNQLALGAVCTYALNFTPTNIGLNTGQLLLAATPTAGGTAVSNAFSLSGTGFSTLASFTVVASPALTAPGQPVSLTVTAYDNTGAVVTDYLGTITFSATDSAASFLGGLTYTFTAGDQGTHTFPAPAGVKFNTLGTFTVSVADNTITGTSNPVTVVNAPTVTLASSVNPISPGDTTVLSISVTSPAGIPTGSVTFLDGATPLGTVTLANGIASLPASFTTLGTHTLTATYTGDTSFIAGTSNTVNEIVQVFTPTITLSRSTNPIFLGGNTVLNVSITGGTGTPTGSVTFFDGAMPIGMVALAGGTGSLAATFATGTGDHILTASYAGDGTFAAGTSNPVTETVEDFTIAVAPGGSGTASVQPGATGTFALLVSPVGAQTFLAPVSLQISGLPKAATSAFAPDSIPAATPVTSLTLSVATSATQVAAVRCPSIYSRGAAPLAFAFLLAPLAFLRRKRRRLPLTLCLVFLAACSTLGLTGCLSSASSGYFLQTPATYPITVTATSGPLSHTVTVELTIE